jgi:hypothetical protein
VATFFPVEVFVFKSVGWFLFLLLFFSFLFFLSQALCFLLLSFEPFLLLNDSLLLLLDLPQPMVILSLIL